ncbi:MAG TPA: hypothetical protein VHO29_09065 [Marmoricola sp.]|nr:hypothetical protein [Marmoricola sp.]
MGWEGRSDDSVLGMLDDLEMQAEGLHLAERAVEVGELSVAQYAEVELLGRLHASVGRMVRVGTTVSLDLHGRLTGTGADWVLISDGHGRAWFVHLSAVALFGGLAPGSLPVEARPLTSRLSLRSALRGLAEDRRSCTLHLTGGRSLQGNLVRVGADFAALRQVESGEQLTVPIGAIAVVQSAAGEPA